MGIDDFKDKRPAFLPEDFFDGRLEGWGVLESLTGTVKGRYTVAAQGRWDAATAIVDFTETWTFDDDHVDTLHWQIAKVGPGRYTGTEDRIETEAVGEQAGCAFHWTYTRDTPQAGGGSTTLNFDDWFYRIDEKVAVVRGSAGRAGIPFGIAHVTYRKLDDGTIDPA